jgi:hypothetical protein
MEAAVLRDLENLQRAEEVYFIDNNRYTTNAAALNFSAATEDVVITIVKADRDCFEATGTHTKLKKSFAVDCRGLRQ